MRKRMFGTMFGLTVGALFTVGTFADVEMYFGQDGFVEEGIATDFGDCWDLQFYQNGGMDFEITDSAFANYSSDGDSDGLYINGGGYTMLGVTRTDGENFGQLEMQSGDGWGDDGDSPTWAEFFLDGVFVTEFDFNVAHGGYYGFIGEFDEMRIAAYNNDGARDAHDETSYQAIWLDDVRFASGDEPTFELTITGDCPGLMTASVANATPYGLVAFAYGFAAGSTEALPVCPGVYVDIANAQLGGLATADANGDASAQGNVPEQGCGNVIVQALDVDSCTTSNVVGI